VGTLELLRNENGQGMAEYSLLIALIAAVLVTVLLSMQGSLLTVYNGISDGVESSATTGT